MSPNQSRGCVRRACWDSLCPKLAKCAKAIRSAFPMCASRLTFAHHKGSLINKIFIIILVLRKPDTTTGFRPSVVVTADMFTRSTETLRLDGRLEAAVLSPSIHQLILAIARLRNVVSSLRIEGQAVDLQAARRVLDTGEPQTPEEKEVLILSKAYEELHSLERPPELSVKYVGELHRRLFRDGIGLDAGPVGRFKEAPNGVYSQREGRMIFEATPPDRTEEELDVLIAWIRDDARLLPPAVASALFFAEFQAIHPFSDGNGRVGRFLNLVLLRQLGYRNVCLVPIDGRFFRTRNRYYRSLRTTNAGRNYQVWCRYYTEQLQRAYKLAVNRADLRPLLEKFSRNSTRSVLEWCLSGDGGWFSRSDFPNPKRYSQPALTSSLAELMKAGALDGRGQKRGREYRLSTEFLRKVYGRELLAE